MWLDRGKREGIIFLLFSALFPSPLSRSLPLERTSCFCALSERVRWRCVCVFLYRCWSDEYGWMDGWTGLQKELIEKYPSVLSACVCIRKRIVISRSTWTALLIILELLSRPAHSTSRRCCGGGGCKWIQLDGLVARDKHNQHSRLIIKLGKMNNLHPLSLSLASLHPHSNFISIAGCPHTRSCHTFTALVLFCVARAVEENTHIFKLLSIGANKNAKAADAHHR